MKHLLPYYYIIEITNRCNFKCPICPHSFLEPKNCGDMSMNLFEQIVDQIASRAKVIQLYWLGEPLLNQDVYNMIRICKQKTNAKVIISTNGSMLSEQVVLRLSQSGLDEIVVSVDACESQDIYHAIRTNGNLGILNRNIEILIRNKGTMHIVLQFIDIFINKKEKELFIKKWQSESCDISISCLYTWASQIPSLKLASDNLSPVQYKKRIPCADLWNKMTINHNGLVSLCCFDWKQSVVLGDCLTDSLINIWNGEIINGIRSSHKRGDYQDIPICKECDAWAEPEEYEKMYYL